MLKLGCYLGPSIDIGSAMTTKILAENVQLHHRSIYRPLTSDEFLDKDRSDAKQQLMARVSEVWTLGPTKRVRGHRAREQPPV